MSVRNGMGTSLQNIVDEQLDEAIFEAGNEHIVTWSAKEIANSFAQFMPRLFEPYSTDEIMAAVENYLDWYSEQTAGDARGEPRPL